jgi:hypothetical protein
VALLCYNLSTHRHPSSMLSQGLFVLRRSHRFSWYGSRSRRYFRTTALQNRFKVLFLGRDEFSCDVFRELYASQGLHLCFEAKARNSRPRADVWEGIVVATNPDTRLGHCASRNTIFHSDSHFFFAHSTSQGLGTVNERASRIYPSGKTTIQALEAPTALF